MNLDGLVPFEGRYELRDPLWLDGGHGGRLALDRVLEREVVFHFPYRPQDNHRFLQMARIRAKLRHASLIPIYDLGTTEDGRPFFTEPYIQATDLWTLRRGGKGKADDVTLPRLVSYFLRVCEAIAFIHANGYLHLDLIPGNVLLESERREVFVQCGRQFLPPVDLQNELTVAGTIMGVPAYMAPEQAAPEMLGAADVRTDVYGLGGILFEILYDSPPNYGQRDSVAEIFTELVSRKGPPRPRKLNERAARHSQLARKLQAVCLHTLESDRTARPANVTAFMNEVEQCIWGRAD